MNKMRENKKKKIVLFIKQHMGIWLLLLTFTTLSIILAFKGEEEDIVIDKEGYGGNSRQIGFVLRKGEAEENVMLEVRPRELTKEQTEKQMKEAFASLDANIQGENDSLSHVTKNLEFSLDYKKYPFDLEVDAQPYALVEQDGTVCNAQEQLEALGYTKEQQRQGILVSVTLVLRYGEYSQEKEYTMTVFPKEKNAIEKQFAKVKEAIENKEKEALYKKQLVLPATMEGVDISRADDSGVTPLHVLAAGFLIAGLLLLREQENRRMKEKKRQEQLLKSYPWFVNEVVLLFGAGMQMKAVMASLINEYERGRFPNQAGTDDGRSALIEELKKSYHSLELGMAEEQVYYQLGRRLKLSCYIKLMTLLEQNVKRGSKGLSASFEQEETNALEERKNLAKRYGEEAGTKLLGPMIMLLLVVMLMIMVPAFMSFA